jgi:hypothetical protein
LDMAPSSPSPPEQSPGTVQRRQLGRGGAGSLQRQHDGGHALPPQPTLAQRPPTRRAQTALLCLPARTGLTPRSAHPHALASHQRPPAPPARTSRSAARPGVPPRSTTRRAPPGRPPSSAYPPATLHRPTHRRQPRSVAAVRSPGRYPPAARTPPAAVMDWGILGNDSKWPSSSVRGSCYN